MRVAFKAVVHSLILTFCLCAISAAQQAGQVKSMKLLTADVGWAATQNHLFWTRDGGAHWKDITPRSKTPRLVASVFFLDPSNGWSLLAHSAKENPETGVSETLFELASTDNAGESWAIKPLAIPD